jgi:two-component system, NarL family, response regulator DevR
MTTALQTIRILLIDDSALVREGIRSLLAASADDMEVVGEAGGVTQGVAMAKELAPDVVLLDIRLPDGNGFIACRNILKEQPDTKILILTSFTNDQFVYDAITSGAHGYLMKEIDPAGLLQAIRDIVAGKSILAPDITAGVMRMMRNGGTPGGGDLSILSAQERRVLALVAEGMTNKQIGQELQLSDNTVKNYLCSVFDKLHVRRRSQAAALYVQATPGTTGSRSPFPERSSR